jgi:hypothetical protein
MQKLPQESANLIRIGVEAMAIDARQMLRDEYLSGQKLAEITGELKESWRYKFTNRKRNRARLYPGKLSYFRLLDRGGTITAKNAQALRFEVDGQEVFARSVRIKRRNILSPFARRYNASSRKTRTAERFILGRLKRLGLVE